MKQIAQYFPASVSTGLCILFCLLTKNAGAAVTYWDPTGATASATPNGAWEDVAWSQANTLTATPVGWVDSTAAGFSAGTAATGVFTVTLDSTQNVAGLFNGLTASIGTVTISGAGALNVPAGQQGFSTLSPGVTKINVPIMGPAQVIIERSGQIYLNATNTYTGGTQLGFSTSPFTGIVNINNSASFGTGTITMFSSGGAVVLQGTAPVTISNAVTTAAVSLNLVGNVAGLTFAGAWNMVATPTIGSGVAGNLVIISGVMSGAGGLIKYNPGILKLTAANTYLGSTIVSNGTLALGPTGSINNSSSVVILRGVNGSIFDVSAISAYALGGSSTLIAQGTGTSPTLASNIKGASGGTVSLGTRPVILTYTPTVFSGDSTHPALYISQGALTLNNNTITVTNAATTSLGIGTYRLIQIGNGTSGVINGIPKGTVSILGSGLTPGLVAFLVVSNGNVNLVVKPPAVISGLTMSQVNNFGIGATSVTLSGKVSAGSIYPVKNEPVTISINGGSHSTTINDATGDFSFSFNPASVPYAATNNIVYIYSGDAALGACTNSTVSPGHAFYAVDSSAGFFSGMNLFFTNTAGITMSTWSSTNQGLPVSDWILESAMQEQPLNDGSGKSRYSVNVTPATSPVYYLCGTSLTWPYLSPTVVQLIITDTGGNYTVSTSNTTITAAGVLGLSAPPVIIQQPVSKVVMEGKNGSFNAIVTGSQPIIYQWYYTAAAILNASNSTMTVSNVTQDMAGNYNLLASNFNGSTTSSIVSLSVIPPPQLSVQLLTNGFQFSGLAVPGDIYWVQSATNLNLPIAWTTLVTNVTSSNGFLQFIDTNLASQPNRFYRLSFP